MNSEILNFLNTFVVFLLLIYNNCLFMQIMHCPRAQCTTVYQESFVSQSKQNQNSIVNLFSVFVL